MTPYEWTLLYNILLWIFVLIYIITSNQSLGKNGRGVYAFLLIAVVLVYICFREIDIYFVDTVTYQEIYQEFCAFPNESMDLLSDYGFALLTYFLAPLRNDRLYFIIIGCLYVLPLYFTFKDKVKDNYYVLLLLFICSFSFIGYGVNGLRNGLSTTFLICAFLNKKIVGQLFWIAIAVSMHKSALLPAAVFLLSKRFSNPKWYIYIWLICMVMTIIAHDYIGQYLGSIDLLGENDNRIEGYFNAQFDGGETGNVSFSRTGFRWDFVLYSIIPIGLGLYFITKKNFTDEMYKRLFCVYVGCNAFWLLTMYIPFNNRFAYLSWFIYPIVMSYPLLVKNNLIPNQPLRLKQMVFINYLFTFFMWIR